MKQNENSDLDVDYTKLLFCRLHVKSLEKINSVKDDIISKQGIEIGILKGEIAELMDPIGTDGIEARVINQRREISQLRKTLEKYKQLYESAKSEIKPRES